MGDDDATLMYLSRRGYGSLLELRQLDTPDVLDLIEYESIQSDLEQYHIERARER